MKGFLKESQLWDVVNGTVVRPDPTPRAPGATRDPPPSPQHTQWILMDEKAQALIRTSLTEAMVINTSSSSTAKKCGTHCKQFTTHET